MLKWLVILAHALGFIGAFLGGNWAALCWVVSSMMWADNAGVFK